jgi:hypothetical protein
MSIWLQTTTRQRCEILRHGMNEMLRSLTPYERDSTFKIHMQEAVREPIDLVAKLVVDDAIEQFNCKWRRQIEARILNGTLRAWLRARSITTYENLKTPNTSPHTSGGV